ncbi:ABC-F family ATP-binding cassette domain-containing protein [Bernardetia sp.]|uniref:ABC-F family ATP-binding cassette domain-containing protein n=1 Tax=Bernardetia sp. TaxID=1937974 RepID=UPI0025C50AEC|nr:ABC-F family ATP-binding cassette domain-containing protein [Bernardetia sp.]
MAAINLISGEHLSKTYGDRFLFKDLNFGISQGEKVALVGRNGAGKSTLLKILAKVNAPDKGDVSLRQGVRVGYLAQDPDLPENKTIWEAIVQADSAVITAIRRYENAILPENIDNTEAMEKAMGEMERLDAWAYDAKIKEITSKLGLDDTQKTIAELSGGQKKRVALAKLLLDEPDLWLLDEPTNHLDLATIEWLENYWASASTTLLLITHDRYFLDKICNRIFELDNGHIYRYEANYAQFLELKSERIAQAHTEADKAHQHMKKELEWIRRQPKARGTKAKYRVEAFEDVKQKAHNRPDEQKMNIEFGAKRQGKKIIELHDVGFEYATDKGTQTILKKFNYKFVRGERIGIIGKNGAGKSTFLSLLTGEIEPQKGRIEKGENTHFGYYTQMPPTFDDSMRVIEVIQQIGEMATVSEGHQVSASQLLTQFNFPPAQQYKNVGTLSGGEKRRLQLLQILIKMPNFLILDEPTNDLDLQTLSVLEEFLSNYGGCLILVSHDRYFLDNLVEHLFVFEGEGKIRDFNGNYTDYREEEAEKLKEAQNQTKKNTQVATSNKVKTTSNKLTFKEKQELETLEKDIEKLTLQKEEIVELMNSGETDYDKISKWSSEMETIVNSLDEKEMRWLELSEKE